jgi:hypothetical protein
VLCKIDHDINGGAHSFSPVKCGGLGPMLFIVLLTVDEKAVAELTETVI